MRTLLQDIRYALKMMVKEWPLTIMIVVTLALGAGANTAIFSVVNAILLRPLPFKTPGQLVMLWITPPPTHRDDKYPAPGADYVDWRDQNNVFEAMAVFESWSYDLTGSGSPQRLDAVKTSASFFRILGVSAAIGRTFNPDEDQPGSEYVAVISHNTWTQRFGADPQMVGRKIILDGESFTVIGVMPEGFDFPEGPAMPAALQFRPQPHIWIPLVLDQSRATNRELFNLSVIGRLKQGVTVAQAQSNLGAIAQRIDQQYRESMGLGIKLVPLQDQIIGDVRRPLLILAGTVFFILLIACSNVANLLLSRSVVRRKELAIRTAMGATRGRLIRQMLTESVLISLIGGAFGLLLTAWGIKILIAANPGNIPRIQGIGFDAKVLVFTFAISLVTGILCALIPTLQSTKVDQTTLLKEERRGSTQSAQVIRLRHLLVISQVGLALTLLIGAGLLIKSFLLLYRVELGFKPDGVLSLRIDPPDFKYHGDPPKVEFFNRVLQQLESLPEVKAAGLVTNLPLSGASMGVSFRVDGRPVTSSQAEPRADYSVISRNFFKAMEIPLLKGRDFTEMDNDRSVGVAIINEAMAKLYWPGKNPLGEGILLEFGGKQIRREIVGVVGDVRRVSLSAMPRPEMYTPYTQGPQAFTFLVIQTSTDPLGIVSAVSAQIHAVDPDHPISEVRSMRQVIAESETERTFNLLLLNIFALLGLILALIGVYGVISHSVNLRIPEIGIRMALGAQRGDVFKMVLKQGLLLTSIGIVIGLGMAFSLTRVMKSLLYQISARDLETFLISCIALALTALPAICIPAFKSSKLDPLDALKKES